MKKKCRKKRKTDWSGVAQIHFPGHLPQLIPKENLRCLLSRRVHLNRPGNQLCRVPVGNQANLFKPATTQLPRNRMCLFTNAHSFVLPLVLFHITKQWAFAKKKFTLIRDEVRPALYRKVCICTTLLQLKWIWKHTGYKNLVHKDCMQIFCWLHDGIVLPPRVATQCNPEVLEFDPTFSVRNHRNCRGRQGDSCY